VSGTVHVRGRPPALRTGCDDGPMSSEEPLVCSAKGCQADAVWALLWNNPKLHTADRRKVWLACDEHRTTLGDFLTARNFLRDIVPVEDAPAPS
jgi:hypothetical protein